MIIIQYVPTVCYPFIEKDIGNYVKVYGIPSTRIVISCYTFLKTCMCSLLPKCKVRQSECINDDCDVQCR